MTVKKYHDPEAVLEAQKYETPVPSRTFLLSYLESEGKPVSMQTFIHELELKKSSEKEGLRRRLKAMLRDGELMLDRKKRFCLIDKLELIKGKVQGHNDGFGFLIPESGGEDYYLSPKQMKKVIPGDVVLAKILTFSKRRSEAVIREVVEKVTKIVGRVYQSGDLLFVKPENATINHTILLSQADRKKVAVGDVVVAELLTHPSNDPQLFASIQEVMGSYMDPGLEIKIALQNYDIPYEWPQAVLKEEKSCLKAMNHAPADWEDLTHLLFVTIDGESARDFDDAVYCEKKPNGGWTLYVAIAHVGYFVNPHSPLDKEAETRGNSVYFPGSVVPMLPEFLSNELCSLKPNEKRASLICRMSINEEGVLGKADFLEGWIESKARLTYTQVAAFYENKNPKACLPFSVQLNELYALYQKLKVQREERGALDLEIPETRILFGEAQKIKKIIMTRREDSHRLIEECMIIANVAAARFLKKEKAPTLYRNHTKPKSQKLQDLTMQLSLKGIKLAEKEDYEAKDLADVIAQIQQRPDAALLQTLILRSLQAADYGPKCQGHFGLALQAYTHFTSPIRRYPDLLVHRAICQQLRKEEKSAQPFDFEQLKKIGEHCSMTERRADQAVWDVTDWLKCEYMLERVGKTYEGVVTSVTDFGLFVTLKDLLVEGLVHVTALQNDYYRYDSNHLILRGERSGQVYRLGDALEVVVSRVNIDERKIDFVLA